MRNNIFITDMDATIGKPIDMASNKLIGKPSYKDVDEQICKA